RRTPAPNTVTRSAPKLTRTSTLGFPSPMHAPQTCVPCWFDEKVVCMQSSVAVSPRVLTDVIPGEKVRDVLLTVGFTLAIAAGTQIAFFLPGNPVPITAQSFVVLAGAVALGRARATIGALGFLALGAVGVP